MISEREFHLQLLARLLAVLEGPEVVQKIDYDFGDRTGTMLAGGLFRLSDTERAYLVGVCRRGLADHHDPLKLSKPTGGQPDAVRLLEEARQVHELLKLGGTQRAACEQVAGENRDHTGVAKNYRKHKAALEASDRYWAALNARRPPDPADLQAMLGAQSKGK